MSFLRIIHLQENPGLYNAAEMFVMPHEQFCCSLMQKILRKNDDVYIILETDLFNKINKIKAVFSYNGYTMNLCLPSATKKIQAELKKFLGLRTLYCISAKTSWAEIIKKIIFELSSSLPDEERNMSLLKSSSYPTKNDFKQLQNENCKIIKCTKNEADALMHLQLSYISEEVLPSWKAVMPSSERINLDKSLDSQIVFALEKNNELVSKVQTNAITKNFIQIGGVYTQKEERKNGYAGILINKLLEYSHEQKKAAVLYVRKENLAALSLYQKEGFSPSGEYSIFYYKK